MQFEEVEGFNADMVVVASSYARGGHPDGPHDELEARMSVKIVSRLQSQLAMAASM
jgi:hypothetical protein